jgi:hypothetical protein
MNSGKKKLQDGFLSEAIIGIVKILPLFWNLGIFSLLLIPPFSPDIVVGPVHTGPASLFRNRGYAIIFSEKRKMTVRALQFL